MILQFVKLVGSNRLLREKCIMVMWLTDSLAALSYTYKAKLASKSGSNYLFLSFFRNKSRFLVFSNYTSKKKKKKRFSDRPTLPADPLRYPKHTYFFLALRSCSTARKIFWRKNGVLIISILRRGDPNLRNRKDINLLKTMGRFIVPECILEND